MVKTCHMRSWLKDLDAIAEEYDVGSDSSVTKKLSILSIELDALELQLPHQTQEVAESLRQLHTARVVEKVFDVLQDILGYYALPDQPVGQNEPIIGSALSHQLKQQLGTETCDVYELKDQLHELLVENK